MDFELVGKLVFLAVTVVVALVVQRVVLKVAKRALDASDVPSASLFLNLLRALIWAFALMTVLKPVFGLEPTAFVAALGVVSVALSLGLQDTISNLIGGLNLLLGKVVQPGDYVTVGSVTGTVVDVNWRSTSVRDVVGNTQVIPNSVLNSSSLTKLTPANFNRATIPLLVRSDADLPAVEAQIYEKINAVLAGRLNPDVASLVRFSGTQLGGVPVTCYVYMAEGQSIYDATDDLMRALSGASWLA